MAGGSVMNYGEGQLPDWTRLTSKTFEDRVTSLLMRLHPGGQRIDGAGGDKGIDFIVPTPAGPLIYQVKHNPGRLTKSRKVKIERSFHTALQHNPNQWYLISPADPTNAERDWLNQLTKDVPPHEPWLGVTWLNTEAAKHQDLLWSWLEQGSVRAKVQDDLRSIGNPVVNVGDLIDAQQRLSAFGGVVSDRFEVFPASTPAGTQLHLRPKPGQLIELNFASLQPNDLATVTESLRWGRRVQFEAPLSFLRLGSENSDPWVFTFEGATSPPADFRLEGMAGRRILASLAFPPTMGTLGTDGGEFVMTDASGWLTLTVNAIAAKRVINLAFSLDVTTPAFPERVAELTQFMNGLREADGVRLDVRIAGAHSVSETVDAGSMAWTTEFLGPGFTAYVDDLVWLQTGLGERHKVNAADGPEVRQLRDLVRMLRGETLFYDAVLNIQMDPFPEGSWLADESPGGVFIRQEMPPFILDAVTYSLDGYVQQLECDLVEPVDRDAFDAAAAAGSGTVQLRPSSGHRWRVSIDTGSV